MKAACIHLLTNPDAEREVRSIQSVSEACRVSGVHYIQVVNKPWSGTMPDKMASDRKDPATLGHYGCWMAHRDAILQYLPGYDSILICECDCIFIEPINLSSLIERATIACGECEFPLFTFGYKHGGEIRGSCGPDVIGISQFIESHCYLVRHEFLPIFEEMFAKPWDSYDICATVYLIDRGGMFVGAWADGPKAVQANGVSLTNGQLRENELHYLKIKHQS